MKYYCTDCSYSGAKSGQRGECPACGSFSLIRRNKEEEAPPAPRWRVILLVGLWTYLIIHVTWKLVT